MAEQLATFPISRRRAKYKWDDWLNGDIWKLQQGTDYNIGTNSLISAARGAAKSRNVRVRTFHEEDYVVLMAISKKESS